MLAHDESVRSKPMVPYLVMWKDDYVETVMDGELVERLAAAAAGESFWSRKKKDPRVGEIETPRALRSAGTLPPAPTIGYELFAGTGEIAVKMAEIFPSLRCVYAIEIAGCVVCDAARRHPRVAVVKCDVRKMRCLNIPRGALVWCSPPCTKYSPKKRSRMGPKFKELSLFDADTYVATCLDFVRASRSTNWVIENPLGELRQRSHIWSEIRHVRFTTSYCKYGFTHRKCTELFVSPAVGGALRAAGGEAPHEAV